MASLGCWERSSGNGAEAINDYYSGSWVAISTITLQLGSARDLGYTDILCFFTSEQISVIRDQDM